MTPTFSSPRVVCRPAIARDHVDVTEFCKGIWDGEDYVPEVWMEWFYDPQGILAVAEYKGHVIGCSKITLISKGQWWLEGFRVDPKHQGKKVGSHLHIYVVNWWLEHGDGTLRLMTDGQNLAIHRVSANTGFTKTHEVCAYRAPVIAEPVDCFSPVTDVREAAAFALASESLRMTNGLIDFGWRICKPDEDALDNHANGKADYVHTFYWWKDKQGLIGGRENIDEDRRTLILSVIACDLKDMPVLFMDVRRLAARNKFDSVFKIAFDTPQIISPLDAAGFEKRWKRSNAFVFEREHPTKK